MGWRETTEESKTEYWYSSSEEHRTVTRRGDAQSYSAFFSFTWSVPSLTPETYHLSNVACSKLFWPLGPCNYCWTTLQRLLCCVFNAIGTHVFEIFCSGKNVFTGNIVYHLPMNISSPMGHDYCWCQGRVRPSRMKTAATGCLYCSLMISIQAGIRLTC